LNFPWHRLKSEEVCQVWSISDKLPLPFSYFFTLRKVLGNPIFFANPYKLAGDETEKIPTRLEIAFLQTVSLMRNVLFLWQLYFISSNNII